ncbi:MAG: restriction endonuclease subunit S [Planctomycetota bacterium]
MMADVPEHWVSTTILEIAELVRGVTYKKEQARDESGPGLVPLLRANNINHRLLLNDQLVYVPVDVVKDSQRLRPNDVVLAMSSGSKSVVGKSARFHGAEETFTFGAFCGVLRPSPDIDSTYFALALQSPVYRRYVSTVAAGVNINNLRRAHLEDYRIPVPPLVEQQAIAAKVEALFSELDAGVAQLEAAQALLKRYRQSVLRAAFEGRLTAEWREQRRREAEAGGEELPTAEDLLEQIEAERQERAEQQHAEWRRAAQAWEAAGGKDSGEKKPRRPARPKDPPPLTEEELASLPELPEGWAWARCASLTSVDVGFAFKSAQFANEGVRLLRGDNIEPGRTRWKNQKCWPAEMLEGFEHLLLNEGEIVLAMDRPLISSGFKIARVSKSDLPALLVQRMARFKPAGAVDTAYLYHQLQSERSIQHLVGSQTGTQLPHISGGGIEALPVALCHPVEQMALMDELEQRMSVVADLERTIDDSVAQAHALRRSILKRAFEGRLLDEAELEAVRSHPDYEPADRLLERIRERAAAQSKTKKQTKKKTTRTTRSARKNTGTPQETT